MLKVPSHCVLKVPGSRSSLTPVQLSGRSLPFVAGGHHRSALSGPGQRAEEGRHQQTAVGVRQHVISVRKTLQI